LKREVFTLCLAALSGTAALAAGSDPLSDTMVLFDHGPDTGTNTGCWANESGWQNFADRAILPRTALIQSISIFTCLAPTEGTVHLKVLANADRIPGAALYEEDGVPSAWEPSGTGYKVSFTLATPFLAQAGTPYWYGLSGNNFDLGMYSVRSPGDGKTAAFTWNTFSFMKRFGDQMFQLMGQPLP